MAQSKAIKNALVTLLSGLQLNGEPAFMAVSGNPRSEFDQYPSIRILPSFPTSEKGASGQNDRGVNLIVRTDVEAQEDGSEIDYMYDLTDLIMDALDEGDWHNSLTDIDPTIGSYILDASRGQWDYVDTPSGSVLMFDINVEVKYSKNL